MTIIHDRIDEEVAETALPFIEQMEKRVSSDFADAKQNLSSFHCWCVDMHGFYHSGRDYVNLRKRNQFPASEIQEDVDMMTADMRDKFFYAGEPCTIVGREDTDRADAEAKQDYMNYLDEEDDVFGKMGVFIRDAALQAVAIAQVDYDERSHREWVAKDIPAPAIDELGQLILDENGQPQPARDMQTGEVVMSGEKEWVLEDVFYYKGAVVKRVDVVNAFWGGDKERIDDEFPFMIRSRQTRAFFDTKPYFTNQNELDDIKAGGEDVVKDDDNVEQKKYNIDHNSTSTNSKKPFEYVEWHGLVDRAKLYKYLKKTKEEMQKVELGEKTWAIIGQVNGKLIVRLQENPFKWDRPNIIIGGLGITEDSMLHQSLSEKLEPVERGMRDLLGMMITNFKQSVNPMWIIDWNAILNKSTVKVNQEGAVLKTNGDVNKAVKQVEAPQMAQSIFSMVNYLKQTGQNRSGFQDIVEGHGDPAAETLGESTQALTQASLRMRDYLRAFEFSFLIPLYKLRNHINTTFVDTEFAFRVVGKKAENWRTITPGQNRASVNFICESSGRETDRAIIIQQVLQFIQLAPSAVAAGQPVRFDRMLAELAESGFNFSAEKIETFFPLLRLERENPEEDFDMMFVQSALARLAIAMPGQVGAEGGEGAPPPGQQLPQDAVDGNAERNRPNVGRV